MSYQAAINEAFACNPTNDPIYDTIELIHSAFTDDNGNSITIRAISGGVDRQARLEEGAPVDSGLIVLFKNIPFELTLPGFARDTTPSMRISVPNVDRRMSKAVEQGAATYDPIIMIYRPYLASTILNGPELNPPYIFELGAIKVDVFRMTAAATLTNISNRPFPNRKYTPDVFKGLKR